MRERVIDALGGLAHPRFLVYLMGPYKAFDLDAILEASDADETENLGRIPKASISGR